MVSGGPNGGPQYNPANVSGTGGNGQSGDYSGFAYGQNKALNDSRVAGNAAISSMGKASPVEPPMVPAATPVTAPSEMPDQHVLHGLSPLGEPNNIPGAPTGQDTSVDVARLVTYLPALEHAASMPTSSEAFRNYVRLVRANITGGPQ